MRDARTTDLEAALPALLDEIRLAYEAEEPDWMRLGDAKSTWVHGDIDEVEAFMLSLVADARWEARAAAAEVLRYLVGPRDGTQGRPAMPRAMEHACVLVAMAQDETDVRVRRALVSAFFDLKYDVGDLLTATFAGRFTSDTDARVRLAVTGALSGNASDQAIASLVSLTRDADDDVRDWACFALGHQLGSPSMPDGIIDTDELREALADRLDDPHEETREEAATGLALRGDARGIDQMEALLAAFDERGVSERVLMTAIEAPSPRYVAPLEAIVEACPELSSATDALAACRELARKIACRSPRHVGCACMRGWFPE